ncbi:MAG TPA: TMEM175 family protein [Bryobacteraceae bacterium]|jgi:uncharacterized membrane protein
MTDAKLFGSEEHPRRPAQLQLWWGFERISQFLRFHERAMREERITADRLAAFSDAVFAVIVTIMVLELKAPDQAAFSALWPLWPTVVSYAVSYLFIAIIWINHHYLMRFVGPPTLGLIWINFVHLFTVSLLPFATAWIARTRLASSPVAFYAGLFVCIDIAYNVFEREVLIHADTTEVSAQMQRIARRRSLAVLASFTAAMLVAFIAPRVGFGLICAALILHLRPDVSGNRPRRSSRTTRELP